MLFNTKEKSDKYLGDLIFDWKADSQARGN